MTTAQVLLTLLVFIGTLVAAAIIADDNDEGPFA